MRPLTIDDEEKGFIKSYKKFDRFDPPKPTFHNCIRCLRQYKLTVPYGECVPVNRDFCDECISELPYDARASLSSEIPLIQMEDILKDSKEFPIFP